MSILLNKIIVNEIFLWQYCYPNGIVFQKRNLKLWNITVDSKELWVLVEELTFISSMKFRKLKFQIIEAVSIKLASFATPYPVHIVIPELKH